jgi:hypothetical protein
MLMAMNRFAEISGFLSMMGILALTAFALKLQSSPTAPDLILYGAITFGVCVFGAFFLLFGKRAPAAPAS